MGREQMCPLLTGGVRFPGVSPALPITELSYSRKTALGQSPRVRFLQNRLETRGFLHSTMLLPPAKSRT